MSAEITKYNAVDHYAAAYSGLLKSHRPTPMALIDITYLLLNAKPDGLIANEVADTGIVDRVRAWYVCRNYAVHGYLTVSIRGKKGQGAKPQEYTATDKLVDLCAGYNEFLADTIAEHTGLRRGTVLARSLGMMATANAIPAVQRTPRLLMETLARQLPDHPQSIIYTALGAFAYTQRDEQGQRLLPAMQRDISQTINKGPVTAP